MIEPGLQMAMKITFNGFVYYDFDIIRKNVSTTTYKAIDLNAPVNGTNFTLNFKATGIKSTSFKDYKEAFAALNI